MSEVQKFEKRPLPKLVELHHDPETAFKNDELNMLLSQPPNHNWIKKHPLVKVKTPDGKHVPLEYIPIDKVKFLLTRIFQNWRSEVVDFKVMFQSIGVQVRLHYQHPVTGEWMSHDGVGAVGVQTDKDSSAADLGAIKQDAVMKALPAAESYALKNAAEKLGNLFGAALGKWDIAEFTGSYAQQINPPKAPTATPAGEADEPEPGIVHFDEKGNSIEPKTTTKAEAVMSNDFEL